MIEAPTDMWGTAARTMFHGPPSRFMADSNMVSSSPSAFFSARVNGTLRSVRFGPAVPALLISTSTRPNFSIATPTMLRQSAASAQSPAAATIESRA